jgi:hypothetical protein
LAARFPGDTEGHRRDSASGRYQSSAAAIFGGLMIAVRQLLVNMVETESFE